MVEMMAEETQDTPQEQWYRLTCEDEQARVTVARDERAKDLDTLLQVLRSLCSKDIVATSKYYPLRFLTDGVDAYLNVFDNAAVYYASSSVELALMTRLAERGLLPEKGLDFRHSIEHAVVSDLLDESTKQLADMVRKVRNSYLHYYNIARYHVTNNSWSREEVEKRTSRVVESTRTRVPVNEQRDLLEFVDIMRADLQGHRLRLQQRMPGSVVRPRHECRVLLDKRLHEYLAWILEAKDDPQEFNRRWDYGMERRDALDCLQWSWRILRHLQFI